MAKKKPVVNVTSTQELLIEAEQNLAESTVFKTDPKLHRSLQALIEAVTLLDEEMDEEEE